jgi:hypothetical protein
MECVYKGVLSRHKVFSSSAQFNYIFSRITYQYLLFITDTMRFAAIIAALAVTATALPAASLAQTGAALGM